MTFCPCRSETGEGARDAAKTGARLGAAAGSRGGPFAAGFGAGLGSALGYVAGDLGDRLEAKLDRTAVTDGGRPVDRDRSPTERPDGTIEVPVREEPLFD